MVPTYTFFLHNYICNFIFQDSMQQ